MKPNLLDRFKQWVKKIDKPAKLKPRQRELPQFYSGYGGGLFGQAIISLTHLAVIAIFIVMMAAVVAVITFTPDGWASLIGQLFATVCTGQKICDLGALQAGFALANIILIYLVILMMLAFDRNVAAMNNSDEEELDAINETNDALGAHFDRLREQNQTIMAMLFMVADDDIRGRMAEMFTETLDDEESEALRDLIEEHEREQLIDESITESRADVAAALKDGEHDIPSPY